MKNKERQKRDNHINKKEQKLFLIIGIWFLLLTTIQVGIAQGWLDSPVYLSSLNK